MVVALTQAAALLQEVTPSRNGGTSQGTGSNPSGDNKGDAGQDGSGEDNEL